MPLPTKKINTVGSSNKINKKEYTFSDYLQDYKPNNPTKTTNKDKGKKTNKKQKVKVKRTDLEIKWDYTSEMFSHTLSTDVLHTVYVLFFATCMLNNLDCPQRSTWISLNKNYQ
jgi:hypothetical protein